MTNSGLPRRASFGGVASVFLSLAALLTPAAIPAAQAASSPVIQRIQQTGVIRIAHRESSVPFSFMADGKPVGYAVDLCLKAADAVRAQLKMPQLRVEWVPVTPATRIPAIVDGKADLECGSTTNNRERREQVAFTIPHYIAGSRMLVKSDSGIRRWSDLRGKTVVSTTGTTPLAMIRKMDESGAMGWKVLEAKDHAEAFAMVESGRADAFVMDDVLLFGLRANAKNPASLAVTGDLLTIEPYAIMLSKQDAEFKKIVDKALVNAIYDQETQKLYRKWFQQPIPPHGITLDIPMSYLLRDSFKFPSDKVAD
ncbi:amino acid ABC transporter substrate-binding protein [Cupriavidus metallidurans]|uniref:Amino acid ABC transporter substrate-binding protein n=1 Tax=Cupriavidus metallidurans TaxID=119219 RepID=A0A482IRV1_9BURK|nr:MULTISPECIES: amino acid ABC transporter substrate-binding protein [Cupriavidus]HBD37008.1 amino acid ABC transporter substrate-binding protein [Cupriavidus sp.]KWR77450.1 amino acid ABC transporter substrate-binding protein [Cupriavidus sp. SHE]QBP10676.1 amino acid ABC transporter substrate-binding protein [Cupriavidus metallidurans]QWC87675.1 amino acid ABC transporter substrate-binding protein [Cupriavidus metallidurans]HBO77121.1 amino acid ABC transporter substrate-binding protein [Cu